MDRFKQNAKNEDQGRIIAEVEAQYGTNFFLFVGVLRDYKGLEYLIRAMEGVKEKLVIIGKGKNKAKLETLASSLGLKNVFFPGYLGDQYLQAFFKLSRAFVLPSIERSEAFGVSLLEASLFSKPMISTELFTGTSFVNKHLETGLVVPPKDISALRKALMKLSSDDQLCKIYGENAQKRYERNFVPEITGKQYLELYDELLISK
ncbi:MAG: glycosyltransferase [Pseudomonadota bacterium]